MTAKQFRAAAGHDLARHLATQCGYSVDNWRVQANTDADIPQERLACMADALDAHIKTMQALARTMRREVSKQNSPRPAGGG